MKPKAVGDTIRFVPAVCVHEERKQRRDGTVIWVHPKGYFVLVEYEVQGILGQGEKPRASREPPGGQGEKPNASREPPGVQGAAKLRECLYVPANDRRGALHTEDYSRMGSKAGLDRKGHKRRARV